MKSIRHQLTQHLVLGALFIAGGGGAMTYLVMRAAVQHQFDESLLGKARAVSTLTHQDHKSRPELEMDAIQPLGFGSIRNGNYLQLRRADGKSIARSPLDSSGELPLFENPGNEPEFKNITLPDGKAGRAVAFSFIPQREDEDDDDRDKKRSLPEPVALTITVASNRESIDAALHVMLATLGLSTVLLLVSAWVFVPRVLRRGLQPLEELAEQVTGITADSLNTRFNETGTPIEMAPITRRLNDLLGRINASFERERRFSADLAHELRTPLAELRSQAELTLKWPDERSPNADADTLSIALRMERLVLRLLALARAESGHAGAAKEEVIIPSIVQVAWRPFAERAGIRELKVDFLIPQDLTVVTDAALFLEILSNLFSNAADYASEGGMVKVEAVPTNEGFVLTVINTTNGIEQGDVERMFDRFWRKEAARSDDEHAGLGLALAQGYARALEWDLRASLESPSLLKITLKSGKR